MAKTLNDVKILTRSYLDEASEIDWMDNTDVVPAINQSFHWLVGKVIEVYDRWYETTTPFAYAVVANVQEYTIDSSIIKVTRVEINYNGSQAGSTASRAVPINEDEVRGNLANTNNAGSFFSSGYYVHGNIGNQMIGFIPVPAISDPPGSKGISVWGIALPSDLVNTTDNVNIPWADNFYQIIGKRAAGITLRKGQQEEGVAARYLAEAENEAIEMQTFLKERQSDDGQYIIDSTLEQIDFSTLEII